MEAWIPVVGRRWSLLNIRRRRWSSLVLSGGLVRALVSSSGLWMQVDRRRKNYPYSLPAHISRHVTVYKDITSKSRYCRADRSTSHRDVGLPAGADAHIRYKSNTNFGAVLIAKKPITLTSYNDETLFQNWIHANRSLLSSLHGPQLRRYGLWIVTRTYTSPNCSINAWDSKDNEAGMSLKAKANLLGELGGDLDLEDKMTDKDWSHYSGKEEGDTVVVFFDGIEVPSWEWWWENIKIRGSGAKLKDDRDDDRSPTGRAVSPGSPPQGGVIRKQTHLAVRRLSEEQALLPEDLWGSDSSLRRGSVSSGRSASRGSGRSTSRGRRPRSLDIESSTRSISTPTRLSRYLDYEQQQSLPSPKEKSPVPSSLSPNRSSAGAHSPRLSTASTANTHRHSKSLDPRRASNPPTQYPDYEQQRSPPLPPWNEKSPVPPSSSPRQSPRPSTRNEQSPIPPSSPPRYRDTSTGPSPPPAPHRRLSATSTSNTHRNSRILDPRASSPSPPAPLHPRELQRKPGSPSLRPPSWADGDSVDK